MRREKTIGHSLQAKITLGLPEPIYSFVMETKFELDQFFIVSKVEVQKNHELQIKADKADGEKCQRCWVYSIEVGNYAPEDVCERCSRVLSELKRGIS